MARKAGPTTIGPQTLVDFPKFGISGVPAKVDTGADSSSIWATNIKEWGGKLSFTLFGPNSPFYTGQVISTRDYEIASIKNSFGNTEFRYKVKIKATIEGRTITVRFTLANRASNAYPVLIGRRTLHGRFLVDVSNLRGNKVFNVLVLKENSANTKAVIRLFRNLEKQYPNAKFTLSNYDNIKVVIDNSATSIELLEPNMKLTDFDLVYFKTSLIRRDIASAIASYLESQNVPVLNRGVLRHFTNNKLKQYVTLAANGVRLPKTYFLPQAKLAKSYNEVSSALGKPFILKDIIGKKGQNNFLIKDKEEFKKVCSHAADNNLELIAQQFVPNNGDYRLLVMGSQVRLVIHRKATTKDTHLNNTSIGAIATLIDKKVIPGFIHKMGIEAARALELDIAGVDMVQDKVSEEWYCLEVNAGPQLATGAYVQDKETELGEYLQRKLSKLF